MATIILIFLVMAAFHFIYECMIAPSLRQILRYRLFAIRDELIFLRINHNADLSKDVFSYLLNSINSSIKLLSIFNIATIIETRNEFKKNKHLYKEIQERMKLVENCSLPEVVKIRNRQYKYCALALSINSGGWLIFLLPIFLTAMLITLIYRLLNIPIDIFKSIVSYIQKLSYAPLKEMPTFLRNETLENSDIYLPC